MSTAAVLSEPESEPPQRALLWDLDNVEPLRVHLASLAQVFSDLVGPDAPRIVAAHLHRYRACREILGALDFEVLSGGRDRDGADRVLMRQARRLRKRGVEQFWVASRDHQFAEIAGFADLHVLALARTPLSVVLCAAASTVTVLSHDAGNWSSVRHAGGAETREAG